MSLAHLSQGTNIPIDLKPKSPDVPVQETLLGLIQKLGCLKEEDKQSYLEGTSPYSRPFIISRKKDADRYKQSSSLLKSLGLDPIQFVAVEGKEIEDIDFLKYGYPLLRPGEKGCLMSHLIILSLAASHSNQSQFTLVFEDDIVSSLMGDGFQKNMMHLLNVDSKKDADIVHLGKCLETCSKLEQVHGNLYKSYAPSCTHALAIKNRFARRVMSEVQDYNMGIDGILRDYVRLKGATGLIFHPSLFYQDVLTFESGFRPRSDQMINFLECNDVALGQKESINKNFNLLDNPHIDLACRGWPVLVVGIVVGIIVGIVVYTLIKDKRIRGITAIITAVLVTVLFVRGGWIYVPRNEKYSQINSGTSMSSHNAANDLFPISYTYERPPSVKPLLKTWKNLDVSKKSLTNGYSHFNPSLVEHKGKKYRVVRASNGKHTYTILTISDLQDNVIEEHKIDPKERNRGWEDPEITNKSCVTGFEDMRVFVYRDRLWLIGVNLDNNNCKPRMVLYDLDAYLKEGKGKDIPLVYQPFMKGSNKNWSPLILKQPYGEVLLLVIAFDPLIIIKPDINTGRCHLIYEGKERIHKTFAPCRNSTVTIHLRDKLYLIPIHLKYVESDYIPEGKIIYMQHRFGLIDLETMTTRLSEPFNVEQGDITNPLPHIEYISGCNLKPETKEVSILYGLKDLESKIGYVSYDKVNELFGETILV